MKVLIKETRKAVGVNIYGIDGSVRTREFFEKYFADVVGVYATSKEEKEEYKTDAEWTIESKEDFDLLANVINDLQNSIDEVQKQLLSGASVSDYTFDSVSFIV